MQIETISDISEIDLSQSFFNHSQTIALIYTEDESMDRLLRLRKNPIIQKDIFAQAA